MDVLRLKGQVGQTGPCGELGEGAAKSGEGIGEDASVHTGETVDNSESTCVKCL